MKNRVVAVVIEGGFDREKARAAFRRAADGGNAEGYYWLDRALDAADPGNTYVTDRVNYLRDWMANN